MSCTVTISVFVFLCNFSLYYSILFFASSSSLPLLYILIKLINHHYLLLTYQFFSSLYLAQLLLGFNVCCNVFDLQGIHKVSMSVCDGIRYPPVVLYCSFVVCYHPGLYETMNALLSFYSPSPPYLLSRLSLLHGQWRGELVSPAQYDLPL